MPSWNELLTQFRETENKEAWLEGSLQDALGAVSRLKGDRNVIFYASAFLQKRSVPAETIIITSEDINGLMSVVHGMDTSRGLALMIHTPGGETTATEVIVDYLRSKFSEIEVIVPTFAMSAGTMISLASDKITMGRQSQLGPIDPQMSSGGRSHSAQAVVSQFNRARTDILENPALGHLWAPILASLGPSVLQEADNAIAYSETLVARWLEMYMFAGQDDGPAKAKAIAHHFNDADTHKNHGRRIPRTEAREQGLVIEDLEDSQELQEAVLTAYHVVTILFEQTDITKTILGSNGGNWIKGWGGVRQEAPSAPQQA